jgi:hypothetical protein
MRIAVAGGTGLVGAHTVAALDAAGHEAEETRAFFGAVTTNLLAAERPHDVRRLAGL